jgi:hypothetical protein
MTAEEKLSYYGRSNNSLLFERDEGYLYLPKIAVLPVIRNILKNVQSKANGNVFEVYGERTIAVCKEFLDTKKARHYAEFIRHVKTLLAEGEIINESAIELFFDIWIEKLINSRINEWFKAKLVLDVEDSSKRQMQQGSLSLRQKLYAFQIDVQ